MQRVEQVPTNIITGALGVGKTTLIQSLLAQKPEGERWAVLVNEFGEVGVDGALLSHPEESGVYIREVPGGCMCCASGLPMQIALNMLLAKAKPHRLLIEPTGLGHPKEVLQTLTAEHYKEVLDVRATLALIDVRKLVDTRWRAHHTFKEQLQIADHVIATKSDLYGNELTPMLHEYLDELGIAETPVSYSQQGAIDVHILHEPSKFNEKTNGSGHVHKALAEQASILTAPSIGSIKVENSGEGYFSCGWICATSNIFDYQLVIDTFSILSVERLKAVLKTEKGDVGFNLSDGNLQLTTVNGAVDSRIEFLTRDKNVVEQTCKLLEDALGLSRNTESNF